MRRVNKVKEYDVVAPYVVQFSNITKNIVEMRAIEEGCFKNRGKDEF